MAKIAEQRKRAKLTQAQLAERLGVERATVSMWEIGKALPRASTLLKLAEVLGCKIEDLFEQKENTAPAV